MSVYFSKYFPRLFHREVPPPPSSWHQETELKQTAITRGRSSATKESRLSNAHLHALSHTHTDLPAPTDVKISTEEHEATFTWKSSPFSVSDELVVAAVGSHEEQRILVRRNSNSSTSRISLAGFAYDVTYRVVLVSTSAAGRVSNSTEEEFRPGEFSG